MVGVVVDTQGKWGAPCVSVINTFYDRSCVPLGTRKPNTNDVGAYQQYLVQNFPTALTDGNLAPEAVATWRTILAAQPAGSVVVASIGFLTNLSGLLQSPPDTTSPLDGHALVAKAVSKLVVMGGGYPSGSEYNLMGDPTASAYVAQNWPTPIVFDGAEIGGSITSGTTLSTATPTTNPVRKAYELYSGVGAGRASWDLTCVLYAVRGGGSLFAEAGAGGHNVIAANGSNQWETSSTPSNQTYLVKTASDATIASVLDGLLIAPPKVIPDDAGCASADASPEKTDAEVDAGQDAARDAADAIDANAGLDAGRGKDAAEDAHPAASAPVSAAGCSCTTSAPPDRSLVLPWVLVGLATAAVRTVGSRRRRATSRSAYPSSDAASEGGGPVSAGGVVPVSVGGGVEVSVGVPLSVGGGVTLPSPMSDESSMLARPSSGIEPSAGGCALLGLLVQVPGVTLEPDSMTP
jgi:hypothetical protein